MPPTMARGASVGSPTCCGKRSGCILLDTIVTGDSNETADEEPSRGRASGPDAAAAAAAAAESEMMDDG